MLDFLMKVLACWALWFALRPDLTALNAAAGIAAALAAAALLTFAAPRERGGAAVGPLRAFAEGVTASAASLRILFATALLGHKASPSLVRVRTRARTENEACLFASRLSRLPGMMAVSWEASGVLAHVHDDAALDEGAIARLDALGAAKPGAMQ